MSNFFDIDSKGTLHLLHIQSFLKNHNIFSHVGVRIRGVRIISFSENFAYVRNEGFQIPILY